MLHIEPDGRLILTVDLPGASRVDVVGAITGWHEQVLPMMSDERGRWRLELTPGAGEFLFRYLIDGRYFLLDGAAHGTRMSVNGHEMSRVWMPPVHIEPDSIAA